LKEIICCKCNIPLEKGRVEFNYLGHDMHADVLKCPSCGQVFISEEMVETRITQVETSLEDK
jgi:predicted RNA-binding Zn-ribbon protein involved in translation (DUF1610 family)